MRTSSPGGGTARAPRTVSAKFRRRSPSAAEQERRRQFGKTWGAVGRAIGQTIRAMDAAR